MHNCQLYFMTESYYLHGSKYFDPLLNHSKFYIVFSLYYIVVCVIVLFPFIGLVIVKMQAGLKILKN
jgi:hypothetical protein